MAYSFTGGIAFGLVYIPIKLTPAVRSTDIGFNMLDKRTMTRVRYKKTSAEADGREVKQEDIVKGYEYDENKYVVFEEKDFEKLKTKKDKNITIEQFADLSEIDPVFYDRPYYVVPTGGEKAYALLVRAMESQNKVGIAKAVLGNREALIALRAKGGYLLLNTLYFADEIQKNPALRAEGTPSDKELKLADAIIESMSEPFDASAYRDEYTERIRAAIEQKIAGKEIVRPRESSMREPADLMDALQRSLKTMSPKSAKKSDSKTAAKSSKSAASESDDEMSNTNGARRVKKNAASTRETKGVASETASTKKSAARKTAAERAETPVKVARPKK